MYVTVTSVRGTQWARRNEAMTGSEAGVPWTAPSMWYGPMSTSTRVVRVRSRRSAVAARAVGDDRAQLVVRDRELRRLDDPAIAQALEPGTLDVDRGPGIQRIGHPGPADVHLAVDTAIGSVCVEDRHAAILSTALAYRARILTFGLVTSGAVGHRNVESGGVRAMVERAIEPPVHRHSRCIPMIKIDHEIVVARPPEAVFDYLADVDRFPEWQPAIERAEQLTPGPLAAGTAAPARHPGADRPDRGDRGHRAAGAPHAARGTDVERTGGRGGELRAQPGR